MEPIVSAEDTRRICVVEDDDDVRASARMLLEAAGYNVRDYASAEAMLEDAAAMNAACFLFDFQLGGMTGLELVERLRARGIQAPAILMTANANLSDAHYKRANVLVVLRKPTPAEELLDWIEKACVKA
jgi:FixJ family two-component response regulator